VTEVGFLYVAKNVLYFLYMKCHCRIEEMRAFNVLFLTDQKCIR